MFVRERTAGDSRPYPIQWQALGQHAVLPLPSAADSRGDRVNGCEAKADGHYCEAGAYELSWVGRVVPNPPLTQRSKDEGSTRCCPYLLRARGQ